MSKDVKVNLKPLHVTAANLPRKVYRLWGERYRAYIQDRFDRFSKGGGNWIKLSEATIARRRKGKKGASGLLAAILRNTSIMFNAVSARFRSRPGQLQKDIPFGVVTGFGGSHRHPGGKATIADIASFHQEGVNTGKVKIPARPIIVDPDKRTLDLMADDVLRAKKLKR